MKTYPSFTEAGIRSPVFQIESAYISAATTARLLAGVEGVTKVKQRRMFAGSRDIHVEFEFLGRPYIVWEPWGDNSRYWIGPADMVEGAAAVKALDSPSDIAKLEDAFKRYRPPLHRKLLGDVLSLRFISGGNKL